MPRKQREKSATGVYHVMMRGINHQDIFEDRGDYWKFLKLLRMQAFPEDKTGKPLPPHIIVYAYCLMSNHVHLLVRELEEGVVAPIKSIAISYAQYFNYKYEHSGQVFQDRFKSEVVNDIAYFVTLLRYIHQNPVAAGISTSVASYTWSSWWEYDDKMVCAVPVCTTQLIGNNSGTTLQHYDKESRNEIIRQLKSYGASIRQISRLTGVSFGIIRNVK